MNIKLKAWIPVGIALVVIGVFLAPKLYRTLFPNPSSRGVFGDAQPDLAKYIGTPGLMPFFEGTSMDLGESGFQARGDRVRYEGDPVDKKRFYMVSVLLQYKPYGTVYTKEFYTRYVPKEEVPDGFWGKDVSEFTTYDEETRTVTFTVGEKNFVCALPEKIFLREGAEIIRATKD